MIINAFSVEIHLGVCLRFAYRSSLINALHNFNVIKTGRYTFGNPDSKLTLNQRGNMTSKQR